MSKTFLIYHGNCYDGFGAAFSVWKSFKDRPEQPTFLSATYGEPFPISDEGLKEADVYISDFSYPKAELIRVRSVAKSLTVLDHHKTAEADLKGLDFAHFDMNRSGAMITWDYFNPGVFAPKLIQYIQDRDLWQFKLPSSREINAIIQSYPIGSEEDFLQFEELSRRLENEDEFKRMVNEGVAVLRSQDQFSRLAIKRTARMIQLGDYEIPVANASVFESEICYKLLTLYPTAPFVATFYVTHDGKYENFSLRSRGDFDVSAVAKKFGGGGHHAASGFRRLIL